jgi:hypothetical protein
MSYLTLKQEFNLPNLFKIFSFKNESKMQSTTNEQQQQQQQQQKQLNDTTTPKKVFKIADDFFHHFTTTFPWQSIYLAENVDRSIEDFLSLIIRNFVSNWYSSISVDDSFILELKILFRHIIAVLIERIQRLDLNYIICYKLNTILFNHVSEFEEAVMSIPKNRQLLFDDNNKLKKLTPEQRLKIQCTLFESMINTTSTIETDINNKIITKTNNHFALHSRRHELAYLRKVCIELLPLLLPKNVIDFDVANELLQEIFLSNVLLQGLDSIAEPGSINIILTNLLINNDGDVDEANKFINNDDNDEKRFKNVQLLNHWCQMNGSIFRSVIIFSFIFFSILFF